ncbi:MAG: YlmC/YmxH family sporulation protein [Ruminococcus sp.]|nr:YlmC/YmxH family sporulation protein [Ruminococcus sp.]
MRCRLSELLQLEMIDICSGERLGYADDFGIDTDTGQLCSLILQGELRCFGLFGRCKAREIPYETIRLIGRHTILIESHKPFPQAEIPTDPNDPLAAYYAGIRQ